MKRFVISLILVFALTSHAYGMGWMGGGGGHNNPGPVVKTNNNNGNQSANGPINSNGVAGAMASNNAAFNRTDDPGSNPNTPVQTPEPGTMLLLAAGLTGFIAFRRKFRK